MRHYSGQGDAPHDERRARDVRPSTAQVHRRRARLQVKRRTSRVAARKGPGCLCREWGSASLASIASIPVVSNSTFSSTSTTNGQATTRHPGLRAAPGSAATFRRIASPAPCLRRRDRACRLRQPSRRTRGLAKAIGAVADPWRQRDLEVGRSSIERRPGCITPASVV